MRFIDSAGMQPVQRVFSSDGGQLSHVSCLCTGSSKEEDDLSFSPFKAQDNILTCSTKHQSLFSKSL